MVKATEKRNKARGSLLKAVFSLVLAVAIAFVGGFSMLRLLYPMDYVNFVEKYAEENNLPENFVYAVIECESGFDKNAVSYADARGLMQLTPDTFNWLQRKKGERHSLKKLFDAEINIKYGCFFYGILFEKYGDEKTAIAAYHAGMGSVAKWLKDERYSEDGKKLSHIPYENTRNYVNKVMKTKNIYSKLYN